MFAQAVLLVNIFFQSKINMWFTISEKATFRLGENLRKVHATSLYDKWYRWLVFLVHATRGVWIRSLRVAYNTIGEIRYVLNQQLRKFSQKFKNMTYFLAHSIINTWWSLGLWKFCWTSGVGNFFMIFELTQLLVASDINTSIFLPNIF